MDEEGAQHLYLQSLVSQITGWNSPADRLNKAFAQDEFLLYEQTILKLAKGGEFQAHIEILVRLREEEKNLTPPGAFLPILEYFDMGPRLDRYILNKTLKWYGTASRRGGSVIHLNLCGGTLGDPDFPATLASELKAVNVDGNSLCFEISDFDIAHGKGVFEFVQKMKALKCRIAVGLPERDRVSFDLLKALDIDYVKIGGQLVRELDDNRMVTAKVAAIVNACRDIGAKTIAQNLERPRTLDTLIRLGVDYAQGYGVSKPAPLKGPARR